MKFIRHWKSVLASLTIVAVFFLIWDAIFTVYDVWGFNPNYHLPYLILGMPIEEYMFFFCIPYASIFIHYSLEYFKPNLILPSNITKYLTLFFIGVVVFVLVMNFGKLYTTVNYLVLLCVLLYSYFKKGIKHLQRFYIAFLIILIPFFVVNGILTGTGLDTPVVWYNDSENLGIRLGTVPVEDIGYAFSMLFSSVLLIEFFKEDATFNRN